MDRRPPVDWLRLATSSRELGSSATSLQMASPTSLQMATLAAQKDCEGCVHETAEAYEKAADSLQNDVRALGTGPEADAMRTIVFSTI